MKVIESLLVYKVVMKKLLYIAISAFCMQNPLSGLTAADVRKGEIALLGEIIIAIRGGDASAVSYYIDADLIAPADYKMLIDEAEMIMAQKAGLAGGHGAGSR